MQHTSPHTLYQPEMNECVSCGAVRTGLSGFGKNQRGRSDFREGLVWFWLKREQRQEHQARTGITVKCRPHGTSFFPSFCLCRYHAASHHSSCSFSCKAGSSVAHSVESVTLTSLDLGLCGSVLHLANMTLECVCVCVSDSSGGLSVRSCSPFC